jgi:copper transport protein
MAGDATADGLLAAARLLWYVGVLGVIGTSACRLVVARDRALPPARLTSTAVVAALLGAAGVLLRLYAQTYAYFGVDEGVSVALLLEVATALPPWSHGWMLQAAAALACLGVASWQRRSPESSWASFHAAAMAVAMTAPLTGHAMASPEWSVIATPLQAVHVAGAGAWLGGLAVLLRCTRPASGDLPLLVARFSPLAIAGAALLATSGVLTAVLYLEQLRDLWTTPYGTTLAAKTIAAAAVAGVGFLNWRWVRPGLDATGGASRLARTGTLELTLAAVVLALTAWLVGLPQP